MMSSLSNDGGVYITIEMVYPNGRQIEGLGIEPDLIIENKLFLNPMHMIIILLI